MAYSKELWEEAKKKCRLNEEDIKIAKEMGLNPKYRFANYHLRLFAQFNLLMNPKCSMLLSTTADFLLLML